MNILVLCEHYSSDNDVYRMAWAHTRNKEYIRCDCNVEVLSFNAQQSYTYDGVVVLTRIDAAQKIDEYDIIISHAPNMKSHFPFLMKYKNKKTVFFFHGHEVLYECKDYPEPYFYMKKGFFYSAVKNAYDKIKILGLKFLIHRIKKDSHHLVFVSEWMKEQYEKNVGVALSVNEYDVIHNPVWNAFVERDYKGEEELVRRPRVVTLRKLDDSKYAVDIVVRMARNNPEYDFYIYGKGRYFDYYEAPSNVFVEHKMIPQPELVDFFDGFDIALLPTRYDAQGVLACEVATFGMPLITSNIDVALEMLEGFDNVGFIDNDCPESFDLDLFYRGVSFPAKKIEKFSPAITVGEEVLLFRKLVDL